VFHAVLSICNLGVLYGACAVLEYVEGGWIFEGSGPPGGLREATARRYFSDVVAGLIYLHGLV
jgi:hypothetical protein